MEVPMQPEHGHTLVSKMILYVKNIDECMRLANER